MPVPIDELRRLRSPFDELIGLDFDYEATGPGKVVAILDADCRHHQPFGIVHGGVYTVAIETVASVGANLTVRQHGRTAVGIHNATDFIRRHVEGRLRFVGEPLHEGRSQHLWSVVARSEIDDKIVARGQVRLAILPADDG